MSISSRDIVSWAEERDLAIEESTAGDVAVFSRDLTLRYALTRAVGIDPRVLAGCGLNPSTADAFKDDPTIRKGKGFARRWGCGIYIMLNSAAYRATNPSDMHAAERRGVNVVGEHNDALIAFVLDKMEATDVALAAWGNHATPARSATLCRLAAEAYVPWRCFGFNKNGSPVHPLYQRWETPLVDYRSAQ